ALRLFQMGEHVLAVLAPGDRVLVVGLGEHLGVPFVAQDVNGLAPVVVGVFVMAETARGADGDGGLAVVDPLGDELGLVLAGGEAGRDGRRRQGGPFAAGHGAHAAAAQAVNHTAVGGGGLLQVLAALVDDRLGHRDAGITTGTQGLELGDGHRALVGVAAVL